VPQTQVATYELIGGWVKIRYGAGEVWFVDGGAASGFSVEVEETGPDEVEVRFRSDDHESKFKAEYDHGELDVEIEEEDRRDEDD
jgi:hypothetical protein